MNQRKTDYYREKTALAHTEGKLPIVKYIALGTGGTINGKPRELTGKETKLFNEIFKKPAEITTIDKTKIKFNYKIDSEEETDNNGKTLVGQHIDEIGLFDENGKLVYIQTREQIRVERTDTIDFMVYLEF